MMGTKARLVTPISALSLDELVPADYFYRHLDRVLARRLQLVQAKADSLRTHLAR